MRVKAEASGHGEWVVNGGVYGRWGMKMVLCGPEGEGGRGSTTSRRVWGVCGRGCSRGGGGWYGGLMEGRSNVML